MKNWKWIPFFVCLTLFLSVTASATDTLSFTSSLSGGAASATDTVSVTLLLPDGTWMEETVSCPAGASLWYASYSESGKTLEAGRASVQNDRAVVSLSQDADSVRAFALGDSLQPLAPAALVKAPSFYQRGIDKFFDEDYAGAISDLTLAIQSEIQSDEEALSAYLCRGRAYVASGETAENLAAAEADFEAALTLDETFSETYLNLADVYIRQADYERAIEILLRGKNKAADIDAIEWKLNELDSGTVWDLSGNLRRESGYDEDGALVWTHEYSYDAQGRQSAVTAYDADGNQIGRIDLEYDADGNQLVDYSSSYEDGLLFRLTYEYDRDGNLTQMREYDAEGLLIQYALYQHDEQGLLIRADFNYRNYETGEMESHYNLFQRDELGNLIRQDEYSPENVLQGYQTWTYNDDGQTKEYRQYSSENGPIELAWREVYEYNARGDCIMETDYDGNGNVQSIVINQYDEDGNRIGSIHYDGNGNVIGYQ